MPKLGCSWAEFGSKMLRRGAVHLSESSLLTVDQPMFGGFRSSPLEPNGFLHYKAIGLEANPLEPARAKWVDQPILGPQFGSVSTSIC